RRQRSQRFEEPGGACRVLRVDAVTVGEEHRVEASPFGGAGEFLEIRDVADASGRGVGMPPRRRMMPDAVEEGIEVKGAWSGHQFITSPPSTTRFCPVTARDQSEAKNSPAAAKSSGVVTFRSGVDDAMRSNTASGVA